MTRHASACAPLLIMPVKKLRRNSAAHSVESRGVHQWLTSQRRVYPLKPEGLRLLASVVKQVWKAAQAARTQDEVEDFAITLHILTAIREGWSKPVLAGYYYSQGVHPFRFMRLRLERHARMEWELHKLGKAPVRKGSKTCSPSGT